MPPTPSVPSAGSAARSRRKSPVEVRVDQLRLGAAQAVAGGTGAHLGGLGHLADADAAGHLEVAQLAGGAQGLLLLRRQPRVGGVARRAGVHELEAQVAARALDLA